MSTRNLARLFLMVLGCALLTVNAYVPAQAQQFDLTAVARAGDPAPAARSLVSATAPSLNDTGQVAFLGDGALFLASKGQPELVAGYGDPAPAPEGATFVSASSLSLNAMGQVAFFARFSPTSGTNVTGLYLSGPKGISKIVVDGDPAPGGGFYAGPNSPALNAGGEVAFLASVGLPGVHLSSQGSFTELVRTGAPAPGGGTFAFFYNAPSINRSSQVAFFATTLGSPSRFGVFLDSGGSVSKIVGNGDPAPGGGTFQNFAPQAVSLSDAGQVAFAATVAPFGLTGIFRFANGQITRLAGEGDPAPGGGSLRAVDSPSLNSSGKVAFRSRLSTGGAGIFLFANGVLSAVARPGDASPEGDTFASASAPSINAIDQIAFEGDLATQLGGVYLSSQGQITRIAGQGDAVDRDPVLFQVFPLALNGAGNILLGAGMFPGGPALLDENLGKIVRVGDPVPGGVIRNLLFVDAMNENRQVAFTAELNTRDEGLFLADGGVITRIAVRGDLVPGIGRFLSVDEPSINNLGDVAFSATVEAPSRSGIFRYSGGELTALVRSGDGGPGGRGFFVSVLSPSINDVGDVAFSGDLNPTERNGVFTLSRGHVVPIAQTGNPAPGGGMFEFFATPFFGPSLNASGQVAFPSFGFPFDSGIFLFSGGTISRVARSGDPAPGGGTFDLFFDAPVINAAGQVAFDADLGSSAGSGVFFFSGSAVSLIARRGDPAPGGGTFRNAQQPSINAQGQVAFFGSTVPGGLSAFLATPR